MNRPRAIACLLTASLILAIVGCSGKVPVSSSSEEISIKGVVKVRGKAVNNGRITFRTANVNRPNAPTKEAEIGKDGTYTINTLVGENFIEVSCKEIFTPQNRDLVENERLVVIKSGENTLDIEIPPPNPDP